jgi:glycosyltransferase involved in cell wall biosynthesis
MKVLHIHRCGAIAGEGGWPMRRLHLGLREAGVDSKILSVRKCAEFADTVVASPSAIERRWNRLTENLTVGFGLEDILNVNFRRIKKNRAYLDADVIHLHRIPQVFSYLAFPSLTRDKPTVFTLHEMWCLTGHCRYSLDCKRWKTGCGKCPYKHLPPAIRHDGTRLQWKLKKRAYRHSSLTCTAPSKWLTGLAEQSILGHFPIYHIPLGVDTGVFKPLEREECRSRFDIPVGKKVLMFAAQRMDDSRSLKGGALLAKALHSLPKSLKTETVLLIMGHKGEVIADAVDMQAVVLGYISDEMTKVAAYSAADLFVSPSRAEAFSFALLESLACGTPAVAFAVGGTPDVIRPGITGYLAEPENPQDLGRGIVQLLEDKSLRSRMSEHCRTMAMEEYNLELMTKRHINLYTSVIKDKVYA